MHFNNISYLCGQIWVLIIRRELHHKELRHLKMMLLHPILSAEAPAILQGQVFCDRTLMASLYKKEFKGLTGACLESTV